MPFLLLIEDDRDALVAGAHLLTTCGFEVEIARSGEDGSRKR
jgi:DNA-binding response OmpR family regulator